jgi:hypothetical protein
VEKETPKPFFIYAFILLAIIVFEYGKAFDFYFVGDDFTFITLVLQNKVRSIWNPANYHSCHFCPLGILLNALPASFGVLNPRCFVLVNFLFFYSCALLIMKMYKKIAGDLTGGFLSALIFSTAVPNAEVIFWKTGTLTIGMTFFSILAFVFFLNHLEKGSRLAFAGCFVAYGLSILCIEQGALAIALCGGYDVLFHSGPEFLSSPNKRKAIALRFLARYLILLSLPLLLIAIKVIYNLGFSPIPWSSRDLSSIPWLAAETLTKLTFLTNTILPQGSSPWVYRISMCIIFLIFVYYIYKKRSLEGTFFLAASAGIVLIISIMAWGPHSRYYCLPLAFYACFLVLFLKHVTGDVIRYFYGKRVERSAGSDDIQRLSRLAHHVFYGIMGVAIALAGLRGNLIRRDYWEAASRIERNAAETVEKYYRAGTLSDDPSRKIYLLNVPDFIWSEKYAFTYVAANSLLLDIRHRIGGASANVIPIADGVSGEITLRGKPMEYMKLGRTHVMDEAGIDNLIEEGHVVLEFSPVTMTLAPLGENT